MEKDLFIQKAENQLEQSLEKANKSYQLSENNQNSISDADQLSEKTFVMSQQTISPTGLQLRKVLQQYQENFTKATEISESKYKHNETNYKHVSETVNIILECTKNYNSKIQRRLTFLVGATGAGKSTLLNYLASDDSNFVIFNEDGAIKTLHKSVAQIGGVSATTLYPNMYQCDMGVFLDCAGEGDTGGIIIEIINSIIKNQISKHVEESKILFVTPYGSLKATGAYGHSFKMALDKNAQFMGDINHLKNNIGFIITGGITKKTAVKSAKQSLEYILSHADVGSYKDTMKQVIENNYIAVFSKPSEEAEVGDTYSPPVWNPNQRQVIIDMINQIPFGKIPSKDFFNVSSNPFVRQTMSKALHIVVAKAGDYLNEVVTSNLPLDIYTVEIEPFSKYINELAIGTQCDLATYVQILKWNNYFKLSLDEEVIAQLQKEIDFLNGFCIMKNVDGEPGSRVVKKNWTIIANLQHVFNEIHSDLEEIIRSQGHNFSKYLTKNTLKTSSLLPETAPIILSQINELYQKEKELVEITTLGKMQQSKFYRTEKKTQLVGTTQQAYTQIEKFVDKEQYQEWRAPQHQIYYDQQERTRKVFKPKTVKQQKEIQVIVDKIQKVNVIEKYQQEQKLLTALWKLSTLFMGGAITQTKNRNKTIQVPTKQVVKKKITEQKQILEQQEQNYIENVSKIKTVRQGGYQTKYKDVVKERQVQKIRQKKLYKDLTVRELNEIQFAQEKEKCQESIKNLRKSISAKITQYPKGPVQLPTLPDIKIKDQFEEKIKDLLQQLQRAEYSAYLVLKHGQTFEIMRMNDILIKLTNMKIPSKAVTDAYFQENPERNHMDSLKTPIHIDETFKATQKGH